MSVDSVKISKIYQFPSANDVRDKILSDKDKSCTSTQPAPMQPDYLPNIPVELLVQLLNLQNKPVYRPPSIINKPYTLGPTIDDTRIIDYNSVTNALRPGTSAPRICTPEQRETYVENIQNINDEIDEFRQGKRGDCYLLSSIYSINNTKNGSKILAQNIKRNEDGSVTVTFPGAIKAKQGYVEEGNGDKCAITGKYTITPKAIEKAKKLSGKSYAFGDIDVIITELAMEAYRAEVIKTNTALNQKPLPYIPGQCGTRNSMDPLSGGQMYDSVYILTGKKSELYEAPASKMKNPKKVYIQGEYGYVCEARIGTNYFVKARKDEKEVTNVYNKYSDLQKMLDKYKGQEDKFAITAGVVTGRKGPDGVTKKGGGHALSVTKITDKYVEIVNPWNTSKKERIPRGAFEDMACALNVTEI